MNKTKLFTVHCTQCLKVLGVSKRRITENIYCLKCTKKEFGNNLNKKEVKTNGR